MVDDKKNVETENNGHDSNADSRIIMQTIEDEMKKSYLDYAMSVIVGRALPDVKDGLKPVHRRILYAMNELSNTYNKPYKKCARIVGEVLGKYHPHGDVAVYDSLVRMAQDFSLRYPLVQGQGNFGSIDGDSAAAMRYCVTGDTLILTDKGIFPINSLSKKTEEKINIKISSYDGKINSASKFFNSGKNDIITIKTRSGYVLRGSKNHPILCWIKNPIPHYEWKLLEKISQNDFVIISRNTCMFSLKDSSLVQYAPKKEKRSKDVKLPIMMNSELGFLLGALVAEGSFHQKKIIFNNKDTDYYTRIKEIILNNFFGIKIYERQIKGNCYELEIYHQQAVSFLKNIGFNESKADGKEIPFSVLQSTKSVIASFLKALFEGDGSIQIKNDKRHDGKSAELCYHSKSKKLIAQLKILLLNFGISTSNPYEDKRTSCYKISITDQEQIRRFREEIGFYSYKKNKALSYTKNINNERMCKNDVIPYINDYLRKKYASTFIKKNNFDRYNKLEKNKTKLFNLIDNRDKKLIELIIKQRYYFDKIRQINISNKKEDVYSIKVDSGCHSFVANGFINHNTEARLAKISDEMLQDIDKETVDYTPNFDGTLKEPIVLPSKFPNLLVNGSSGIAVGMATNIPPHNLQESCEAVIALIDNPMITTEELCEIVKGPDFPTAAEIIGKKGIIEAYNRGKGIIKIRSVIDIEEKKGRKRLIVKQIPYQVNKSQLVEDIAALVHDKKITDISDLRDESDRDGVRIVIELKKDANPEIVKNLLYNFSRLEDTFGINMIALVDNEPKLLSLKSYFTYYVDHRITIVRKRCMFDLKKAEERAHILEGLRIALTNIDSVVALIKKSKSGEDAKNGLMTNYLLTEVQAQAILDMKLQKIAALEQEKINNEYEVLLKVIIGLKEILGSESKIRNIIKDEMREIIEKYAKNNPRKTKIIDVPDEELEFEMEDLIPNELVVITMTHSGYVKRMPLEVYKVQNRGGKGIIASDLREGDFIEDVFVAKTHSYLLIFTNKGKLYWLKVYKVPDTSRQSLGKAIVNLLELGNDEKVNAIIPVNEFDDKHYLVMATKNGTIKKTNLVEFSNPRRGGILAINIDEENNDFLINVVMTDGMRNLMLATANGQAARFNERDVRSTGRNSSGVRGIRLGKDDSVVGMIIAEEDKQILTITENGYGKRTSIADYRLISRGGKGVRNIICSARNGQVVGILGIKDTDEVMFISKKGILIRTEAGQISIVGRNTQGVRLIKLSSGDQAVSMTKIMKE